MKFPDLYISMVLSSVLPNKVNLFLVMSEQDGVVEGQLGGSMVEWSVCWTSGFESRSGHLLDLFFVVLSSNPRPCL